MERIIAILAKRYSEMRETIHRSFDCTTGEFHEICSIAAPSPCYLDSLVMLDGLALSGA
jgi:hypothetical protein